MYPGVVRVFAINPGSTSTKLALLEAGEGGANLLHETVVRHQPAPSLSEDLNRRRPQVTVQAEAWAPFDAVAARGGLLRPLPAGVYVVDEAMVQVCLEAPHGAHPANLAAPLALELARKYGVPAFVVDPPTVDELDEVSRISGAPGVPRRSRVHALNLRYTARKVAAELGARFEEVPLVGAHLGGGTSVVRFAHGRMVDTNDALLGEGPFSPNRAGTVPVYGVIEKTAREGRQAARNFFGRASGFKGLLGTDDLRQVEARLDEPQVRLTTDAYALQVAKYMLGLAAGERPQAFFLTGAGARFGYVVQQIEARLSWAAPVHVHPGEFEMQALAAGAWRALSGQENPKRMDEVRHGSAGL